MVIRNVIFDFGNVIVDLDREGVARRFAEMGVDVAHFLGISAQKGVFEDLELGRIEPDEWCERFVAMGHEFQLKDTPLTLSKEKVIDAWNSMLAGIPRRRLLALQELHRKYHVSLLSNTNQIHVDFSFEEHFRKQGFEPTQLFEHIFLSNEMHLAKPGKTIFERVLQESGYKPEETLFIDDSAENCAAFAELGVQTFCPRWADEWMQVLCPAVATIGFFDGVHKGHRFLLDTVKDEAQKRGMRSVIVTFAEHPRAVLHDDYVPQLLTSPNEKMALLQGLGVDNVEMLHFTDALSQLSARDFMKDILRDKLGVKVLVMGYDHHFGHGGGSWDEYQKWGDEVGIDILHALPLLSSIKDSDSSSDNVSSSMIRKLLQEGRVADAAVLLGHHYTLLGKVVTGHQVGHELGFPTANLKQDTYKLVPANGVYAVWVELEDGTRYAGMLNIGNRPTIDNGESVSIEVNLLDFEGDLYNHHITVHFVDFLREERKFGSREELVEQIKKDKEKIIHNPQFIIHN